MSEVTQDRAEGYMVDVEYVHNFHPGLAPLNLSMAAVLSGVRPPDVDQPFTYLDLGCGHGFSAALFAAAYPQAEFWGADFLPAHIRAANALVATARLSNATFVEASFADLLDRDLPRFDFVVAHGIWSWVNEENRQRVTAILDRVVKPGGLVVVSYNCRPGWDSALPLRRLLIAAAGKDGTPTERIERALGVAQRLRASGADYFRNNPTAGRMLDTIEKADRAYVAHEYFNENWTLFEPGEVTAALQPAGLSYVGQARLMDDMDPLWLTPEQRALVAEAPDRAAAESLRDLILDRTFRHDLFVRAPEQLDERQRRAWIDERRFVLARPRSDCTLEIESRTGDPAAVPAAGTAILDALAQAPATSLDLAAMAELEGQPKDTILEALLLLAAMGHLRPALGADGNAERRAAADRFNDAALDAARMADAFPALASPVIGSGVAVLLGDQLLLDATRVGIPLEVMTATGAGGVDRAERFRDQVAPLLRTLGIL